MPRKSQDIAVRDNAALVALREQMGEEANEIANRINAPTGRKIKTKGSRFTFPDGDKQDGPIELVVVDFIAKNTFYSTDYDPDEITPPDCFAIGQNIKDLAPSPNAIDPQHSQCKGCPNNEFGTASNGSGKACRNGYVLAVLPPDASEEDELMLLDVSPTGMKSWEGAVRGIQAKFGTPPIGAVLEVGFDETVDYPKLEFGDFIPNENFQVHLAFRDDAKLMVAKEPEVQAAEEKKPATKKANPRARGKKKVAARR